jgi:transcriptional regulator with XRE-family HTH domain
MTFSIATMSGQGKYTHHLLKRVAKATRQRGARTRLAEHLEISTSLLAHYLSGASAPSAEIALRLLEWVTDAEAKKVSPANASTSARPVTRSTKHTTNAKRKTDRGKT